MSADSPPSRPTIRSIALRVGVSSSTVSRALRNDPRISQEMRRTIHSAAAEAGYTGNPFVRAFLTHIRTGADLPGATIAYYCGSSVWAQYPLERLVTEAIQAHAAEMGFSVDVFFADQIAPKALRRVLKARGIRGVILRFQIHETIVAELDLADLACASVYETAHPTPIHETDVSQLHAIRLAMQKLLEAGYQKPGLLYPSEFDEQSESQIAANFAYFGRQMFGREVPLLLSDRQREGSSVEDGIRDWLHANAPDCLVTHDALLPHLKTLERNGVRLPPLVLLDRSGPDGATPGTDSPRREMGAAAVDLIAEQITHNRYGAPKVPKRILFEPKWGGTLPPPPTNPQYAWNAQRAAQTIGCSRNPGD